MKTIKLTIELRWKLEHNFVGCLIKNRLDMKLKSILLYFNIKLISEAATEQIVGPPVISRLKKSIK